MRCLSMWIRSACFSSWDGLQPVVFLTLLESQTRQAEARPT